jgi:hypothetical protein
VPVTGYKLEECHNNITDETLEPGNDINVLRGWLTDITHVDEIEEIVFYVTKLDEQTTQLETKTLFDFDTAKDIILIGDRFYNFIEDDIILTDIYS